MRHYSEENHIFAKKSMKRILFLTLTLVLSIFGYGQVDISDMQNKYAITNNKIQDISNRLYLSYQGDGQPLNRTILKDSLRLLKKESKIYELAIRRSIPSITGSVMDDYHIYMAGENMRKAYICELAGMGCTVVAGMFAAMATADENDMYLIGALPLAACGLALEIVAYTYHFKCARELRISGCSITYTF